MAITNLKLRLGIAVEDVSQDSLVTLLQADAQQFFKDTCNRTDIPDAAVSIVDRLAVVFYSLNADQYKQNVSLGNFSRTNFSEDDIPKSMRKQLRQYRKVVFV